MQYNSQDTSTSVRTQHHTKGVRYKPRPGGTRTLPQTPKPSRKKGIRTGRELKPRTAKQPALEIHTQKTDTRCMGCWILEKWKSKTCGQVPATGIPETKEKRVLSASLKETGTP